MDEPCQNEAPLTFEQDVEQRASAYPGTLTYHDLIRKSKRDSTLLIAAMVLLTAAVAGGIAGIVGARGGIESLLPSIAVGVVAGALFAGLGALWSWRGGASAILRMSGARRIDASEDPELFNVVDEMRIAAGLPMPAVYLIDDSALNAFATGRDPEHGVVAVTTGLRARLNRDQLQGVVAHEMAHIRHYDIRFAMLMATMVGLIAFMCDAFLRSMRYGAIRGGSRQGNKNGGVAAVVMLVAALLLMILAPLAARIVQMSYSRRREYLADAGAVELTRNPEGLASALTVLANDRDPFVDRANRGTAHLFIANPLRKMARLSDRGSLFSSHPPIRERVARLRALSR